MSVSRAAGSISVSWKRPAFAQGYKIYCAIWENNDTGTYTLCADVSSATAVNGRYSATISSWTADGTNYTIDDSKTYDLSVRTTNTWGESYGRLAPLIYPITLTASNVGATTATLTIANHSGNWYYKANAAPDNTCKGPVSSNTKDLTGLTGLTGHTSYIYSAYSDSTCASANLLTTATPFTTLSAVSNLTNAVAGDSDVLRTSEKAIAFTTGANSAGYTLQRLTAKLKQKGTPQGTLRVTLRPMQSTGEYDKDSQISSTILATLSGTPPTSSNWTDTTFTCSGSGCHLTADTTYFLVIDNGDGSDFAGNGWTWAYSLSSSVTKAPTGNGWDLHYGHYREANSWRSYEDWHPSEITFETVTTLTPSNLTATGATLTIAGYPGDWYYKYTSPSGGTCSSAVSGASTTVTMGGGSHTFAAYSDASCSNLLATTIAFSKDATPAAPSVTAVATENKHLSASWQKPTWATKYHVTYTCNNGGDWGLVANGTVASQTNLSQTGQTVTATVDLSAGWWNNQSPACRMGVRAGNDNGWSSWAESNSVGPLPTLTSSNVSATGATLTIANHTGDWYYKYTAPSGGTCSTNAVTGTSTTVTLAAVTTYTFAAYSDSSCSTLLATASSFTTSVTVSNLGETNSALSHLISGSVRWAQGFTTGSNSGGYTLSSVTLNFNEVNSGANNIIVSLRSRLSNGKPNTTTALATLSGTVAVGDSIFTCSGAGCELEASTQYFVHIVGTGNTQQAKVNTTESDAETLQPSGNGWSIANAVRYSGQNWNEISQGRSLKLRVTALPK